MSCKKFYDHESGVVCECCKLLVDEYGNTEEDFHNCSFPDCGCDGSRLCQATNGANQNSLKCNVESMYRRKDRAAIEAREDLLVLLHNQRKQPTKTEGGDADS